MFSFLISCTASFYFLYLNLQAWSFSQTTNDSLLPHWFFEYNTVVGCRPKNIQKPKHRKTGLYLVFFTYGFSFSFITNRFYKRFRRLSNQPQVENHEDVDDCNGTPTIRSSHTALATKQSQIVRTARKQLSRNTAVQHQTRDKPDGLSQLNCCSHR